MAAAGTATVAIAYLLVKRSGDARLGVVVASLFAANPYLVWYGQEARMYTIATLLSAATLYWSVRVAGGGHQVKGKDYWALALASVSALYTHYLAIQVVAPAQVYAWGALLRGRRSPLGHAPFVSHGAAALLLLPWLILGNQVFGPGYGGNVASPPLVDALASTLTAYSGGAALPSPWREALAISTIGLAGLGAVYLGRRRPSWAVLLGVVLLGAFAALYLASRSRPVFAERYLMMTSPALFWLVAYGVGWPLAWIRRPSAGFRVAAALVMAPVTLLAVGTGLALQTHYEDRGGRGFGEWRDFVGAVVERVEDGDVLIVNHLDPSFFYYYRRMATGPEPAVHPSRPDATPLEVARGLGEDIASGQRAWLIVDVVRMWDRDGKVMSWLERAARMQSEVTVGGMRAVAYRLPAPVGRGARFGDLIELVGYEPREDAASWQVGAIAEVDLVWAVRGPIATEYTVSLQLLDEQGRLVAQSDGPPAEGRYPTSGWRPGDVILDGRALALPSQAGRYTLGVAVYDPRTGERLPVPGTADNLARVAEIGLGR